MSVRVPVARSGLLCRLLRRLLLCRVLLLRRRHLLLLLRWLLRLLRLLRWLLRLLRLLRLHLLRWWLRHAPLGVRRRLLLRRRRAPLRLAGWRRRWLTSPWA